MVLAFIWLTLVSPAVAAVHGAINIAELQERNYQSIIDRNPFGLRPPAPRQTNRVEMTSPVDQLLLTGIVSFGEPRAYFMTKAPPGKTPEYYSLGIGEQQDGLKVIDIDPVDRVVRVRSAGAEETMDFKANGVKPPALRPNVPTVSRPMVSSRSASQRSVRAATPPTRVWAVSPRQVRTSSRR